MQLAGNTILVTGGASGIGLAFVTRFLKAGSAVITQPRPAILNVTSGLAFAPISRMPVYCATKAALRSFTLSLRHQLAATPVEVVEVIPPAVNTDLGGVGLHGHGAPVDDFADHVLARLAAGDREIPYGTAEKVSRASREELDETFRRMNS